jgi:hypothetical protein
MAGAVRCPNCNFDMRGQATPPTQPTVKCPTCGESLGEASEARRKARYWIIINAIVLLVPVPIAVGLLILILLVAWPLAVLGILIMPVFGLMHVLMVGFVPWEQNREARRWRRVGVRLLIALAFDGLILYGASIWLPAIGASVPAW